MRQTERSARRASSLRRRRASIESVTVKAISVADNTKSDTATVTLLLLERYRDITPKRGGLTPGQTMTFTRR